jgi:hypothetical protein
MLNHCQLKIVQVLQTILSEIVLREIDNQTMNITNEIIQVANHTEIWDQGEIISAKVLGLD